jgi:hypothetical protein
MTTSRGKSKSGLIIMWERRWLLAARNMPRDRTRSESYGDTVQPNHWEWEKDCWFLQQALGARVGTNIHGGCKSVLADGTTFRAAWRGRLAKEMRRIVQGLEDKRNIKRTCCMAAVLRRDKRRMPTAPARLWSITLMALFNTRRERDGTGSAVHDSG